jgi:hypothetical protein
VEYWTALFASLSYPPPLRLKQPNYNSLTPLIRVEGLKDCSAPPPFPLSLTAGSPHVWQRSAAWDVRSCQPIGRLISMPLFVHLWRNILCMAQCIWE